MTGTKIIAVDVGGTFTDIVAIEDGEIRSAKVPTIPNASDRSVLAAAQMLGVSGAQVFNLASTAGLNAVLTRRLPKVGLLTTYGHRDVLDRGSLIRPVEALTDPSWSRSFGDSRGRPLVPRYLRRGIKERTLASGQVLIPLDEDHARQELRLLKRCNIAGIAICLLHAYRNDVHEKRLHELVREELGAIPCSISSATSPIAREFYRASTTIIDVLMKSIYGEYTDRLTLGLFEAGFRGQLNYSDSSANLLPAEFAMERPYQLVMGGPAGGAVSAAHLGRAINDGNLLCADVGGTSVDISVIVDGQPWSSSTYEIEHDLIINTTSINIVTLGAGGGSIIAPTASGDIATGPDSAGAQPGPACYGQGGTQPTVTDAAILIGVLAEDRFLGGRKKLKRELSLAAFASMETGIPLANRVRFGWEKAVNNIAEGLLNIAVSRGIDSRDFTLVACGAAGPMLLPCILDLIPLRRLVVPPYPGLFSALGLVSTDRVYSDHTGAYLSLRAGAADQIDRMYRAMEERLRAKIESGGLSTLNARVVRTFDARYLGQSWETPFVDVPAGPIDTSAVSVMIDNFCSAYETLNGTRFNHLQVEAVSYRTQIVIPAPKVNYPSPRAGLPSQPTGEVVLQYLYEMPKRALEYERASLGLETKIEGPAVIREEMSTSFVPPGRSATVGQCGELNII